MAAPSLLTTGTFGSLATLASSQLTAIQANIKVVGLTLTQNADVAKLKEGANVTEAIIAHNMSDALKVDFIYKGSNFPRITPLQIVTVSASSSTVIDGEYYYGGDLSITATLGDFTKYSMTLYREYSEAGTAVVDLTP
jgi:hypothetical protein